MGHAGAGSLPGVGLPGVGLPGDGLPGARCGRHGTLSSPRLVAGAAARVAGRVHRPAQDSTSPRYAAPNRPAIRSNELTSQGLTAQGAASTVRRSWSGATHTRSITSSGFAAGACVVRAK